MPTFPKGHAHRKTHADNARLIAALNADIVTATNLTGMIMRHTASDELTLRGIPAIGPGCPGRIRGTRPDQITDRAA